MNETKRRLLGTSRNRPLYFAGRRDELSKLERHKRYVQETRDPAGGLMLIDGVQGIGKTQLMNEFAERVGRDSAVRVVRIPTPDLDDQLALFVKMVRALGGSEGRARRMAGVGGGLIESRIAGRGVARARAMQVLPSMNEMLERSRESALWRKRLLLLLVDEIQNMTPSQGVTLRMLHEGAYGCPVMVLCAGLQHATQQLARNAGISRYAGRLRLAPLSRNETIDAFVGGMEAVGFGISEDQASVLAAASMDFPQHIHGYLEGAIAAVERHASLASGEAMAEAKAHGDLARVEYYEGRLSAMGHALKGLRRVAAQMDVCADKSLYQDEVVAILNEETQGQGPATVEAAVEKGILTADDDGYLSFGIPSFHDYMIARRERDLRHQAQRERQPTDRCRGD